MTRSTQRTASRGEDDGTFELGGHAIALGETRDMSLPITQSYSGAEVTIPVRVVRGPAPGPVVLLTAAVHGDELNGIGIIREVLMDIPCELKSGTLVMVPVVNILGFERNSRYLPDRRDLNRSFPGASEGSMASRIAHRVFNELILKCDYLIDFHTAAVGRTNFPNVRADLSHPETERIAYAFGCSLVVDSQGPKGNLRRAAVDKGRAAIILEAGEVSKIEPSVLEAGVRGVRNVLIELGMGDGTPERPAYQATVDQTHWLRASAGGLLRFHAAPGALVEKGQPVASCSSLLGEDLATLHAPEDGIIMGLTTLPSVKPGDPVCHLAMVRRGISSIQRALDRLTDESLHDRLREDLASSVSVEDHD